MGSPPSVRPAARINRAALRFGGRREHGFSEAPRLRGIRKRVRRHVKPEWLASWKRLHGELRVAPRFDNFAHGHRICRHRSAAAASSIPCLNDRIAVDIGGDHGRRPRTNEAIRRSDRDRSKVWLAMSSGLRWWTKPRSHVVPSGSGSCPIISMGLASQRLFVCAWQTLSCGVPPTCLV